MIFPSTHIELERAFCTMVGVAGWNTAVNSVKSAVNRALVSTGERTTAMTDAPYFKAQDLQVIACLAPAAIMVEVRKIIIEGKSQKVTA